MKCESESKCGCESMESGEGKEGGGQTKTQLFSFLPLRPSSGLGRMEPNSEASCKGRKQVTVLTIGSYGRLAP
jgi:hypothetical protein